MRVRFNLLWILYIVAAIFLVGYFILPVTTSITLSSNSTSIFYAFPDTLYLNATNGFSANISVGSNVSYAFPVDFTSNSTKLTANYSQETSNIFLNVTNHSGFVGGLINNITPGNVQGRTTQRAFDDQAYHFSVVWIVPDD